MHLGWHPRHWAHPVSAFHSCSERQVDPAEAEPPRLEVELEAEVAAEVAVIGTVVAVEDWEEDPASLLVAVRPPASDAGKIQSERGKTSTKSHTLKVPRRLT